MGRPIRLTDEERKRSNAERQRRWKAKHLGFAKLKEKNAWLKRKAIREKATPNEKVFTPNAGGSKGNEKRTYAQLEEFKARRAQRDKGVQVDLIL
jgi:hypothetical protein